MALVSFVASLVLVLLSVYVAKLSDMGIFIVGSTGASVTLGLALIEQRLAEGARDVRRIISEELSDKLDLIRAIDQITDSRLQAEVYALARALSAGTIPPHIAALRIPAMYESAAHEVYASNVSLTAEKLYQWIESPRFRGIVETSKRRGAPRSKRPGHGPPRVKFSRTFVLRRSEVFLDTGEMEARCWEALRAQRDAHITVRIIWIEDLESDTIRPTRPLVRNFTIFDGAEAVDTTDVQRMYRLPSDKLQEFLDTQTEQIKYGESVDRYLKGTPPA